MLIIPILLFLLRKVFGGTIISYDIRSEWQNAGYLTKLFIRFSLENSIYADDYLRFESPVELGYVNAKVIAPVSATLTTTKTFFDYYISGFAFSSGVIYEMELTISLIPTTGGVKGIFKMYTTSDASKDGFVYDYNEMFGIFAVAPLPNSKTLKIESVAPTTSEYNDIKNKPNSLYELFIDFKTNSSLFPFKEKNASARIIATLSEDHFTLKSCEFVNFTCPSTNTSCLNSSKPNVTSCTPNSIGFIARVDSALNSNETFRIKIQVENPGEVAEANIQLQTAAVNSPLMWEISESVLFALVDKTTVTVTKLAYLWGITPGKACPIGFYQPIAIGENAIPVINNVIAEFTIAIDATGKEYGVTVMFGSRNRLNAIIEGSIFWKGFTPMQNGEIECTSNFPQINADLGVVCRGINSFSKSSTYSVGARVYTKVYDVSKASADKTEGQNFPKITAYSIDEHGSSALSTEAKGPGSNFYINYNLVATKNHNLFTIKDKDGNSIFGSNWALSYKSSSSATNPLVPASIEQIIETLCVKANGIEFVAYENSATKNCSAFYKYGIYKESSESLDSNRILFFINPSEFSSTNAWDALLFPNAELAAKTHIVHKFILNKAFLPQVSKRFGFNIINGLFTNSPSAGTSGADTCGPALTDSRYCYTTYNTDDANFDNGVQVLDDSGSKLYLYNKYNESATDHLVITITCIIKTADDGSCAFKTSSRNHQSSSFPGFEIIVSNSTLNALAVSSLYPDENVRDLLYCNYIVPFASINTGGTIFEELNEAKVDTQIKLKMQGILNWFHLNVPTKISSAAYYLNNLCVENSDGGTSLSYNDGNHIPLLFRIQYDIQGNFSGIDATALFFATKGNLASTPTTKKDGIFGKANGRSTKVDFLPHIIPLSFYSLSVSNKIGTENKIGVKGYGVTGEGTIQPANVFTWNYHPSFFIPDNSMSNDIYVHISHPIFANDKTKCNNFYMIDKLVIALLGKKTGNTAFFDVKYAFNIFSTMSYSTSGFYSSKNSLNLGNLFSKITGYSGAGLVFDQNNLYNPSNCLPSNSRNPFTTQFVIGSTTRLRLSTKTTETAGCKEVSTFNGNKYGSAITFSSLSNVKLFKKVFSSTSEFEINKCAYINIASTLSFKSSNLNLEVIVCPLGLPITDLSATNNYLDIDLDSTIPWYWGVNTHANPISILKEILTVGWAMDGQLKFATGQNFKLNEPQSVADSNACLTEPLGTFYPSTNTQKVSWSIRSKLAPIVLPLPLISGGSIVADSNQGIQIDVHFEKSVFNEANFIVEGCLTSNPNLDCKVTKDAENGILNYELTPKSSVYIPNDIVTITRIYLFVSVVGVTTFEDEKYNLKVNFLKGKTAVNGGAAEMKILDCGNTGTDIIFNSQSRSNALNVNELTFSKSKSIISPFSVTFEYPLGLGFWNTPSNTAIQVTTVMALGSLWNSPNQEENVKCIVFQDSRISHDFSTIKLLQGTFTLKSKANKDVLFAYEFKCYGGQSPATETTNFTITASSSRGILAYGESPISGLVFTPPAKSSNPLLNVKFTTATFYSIWNFTLIFSSNIIFGRDIIFARFPTSFLPSLSHSGNPYCTLNSVTVLCAVFDLNSIAILPEKNYVANISFNLVMYGIVMPSKYSSFSQIEFQLDNNTDVNDGIVEKSNVQAVNISSIGLSTEIIELKDYNRSSDTVRQQANHTFIVSLKPSQVKPGGFFYLTFEEIFHSAFIKDINLTFCEVYQEFKENVTNLASNCSKIGDRFVKIQLNSNFSEFKVIEIFYIKIGPLYTPEYSTPVYSFPKFLITDSQEQEVVGFTTSMYSNATISNFSIPTDKLNVQYFDISNNLQTSIIVYRGFFGTKLVLKYPTGSISTGLKLSLANSSKSHLFIHQKNYGNNQMLIILSSESKAEFLIAASPDYVLGKSVLKFDSVQKDSRIIDVPELDINIVSFKCFITPKVMTKQILVAKDSQTESFPIIFNFTDCVPLTNITVNVSVDNNTNAENLFSIDNPSQTLVNNFNNLNKYLFFKVIAKAGTDTSKLVNVNFTIGGANADFFQFVFTSMTFQTQLFIESVSAPAISSLKSVPGEVSFEFNCKEASNIFYLFGIGLSIKQQATIEANTYNQKILETTVDKSSSTLEKYGWISQESLNSRGIASSVGDLKTKANYTLYVYCKNLKSSISSVMTTNWIQADTGAEVGRIDILFSREPNSTEKLSIMNFICLKIEARYGSVSDIKGNKCNNIEKARILQTSNTTNEASNTNYTYTIYYHPNVFLAYSETKSKLSSLQNINFTSEISLPFYQMTLPNFTYFVLPSKAPSINSSFTRIDPTLTSFNSTLLKIRAELGFYFFSGISSSNSLTPTFIRLLAGQDGDGKTLLTPRMFEYYVGNTTHEIMFGPLNPDTEYKLYFILSSENIGSSETMYSPVYQYTFRTKITSDSKLLIAISVYLIAIIVFL